MPDTTTALYDHIREQITRWEGATPGSRDKRDAAEAFTRAFAELDAALRYGVALPDRWEEARREAIRRASFARAYRGKHESGTIKLPSPEGNSGFGSGYVPDHAGDAQQIMDREPELPESLRLAASLRTCGDPECNDPAHMNEQGAMLAGQLLYDLADWIQAGGAPHGHDKKDHT